MFAACDAPDDEPNLHIEGSQFEDLRSGSLRRRASSEAFGIKLSGSARIYRR